MLLCLHISRGWAVAAGALAVFAGWWLGFYYTHSRTGYFFFDSQDCAADASQQNRKFPLSAKDATFEPLLKHYIGVTQMIVTVAAACIAFGGTQAPNALVVIAKLILAWRICFGVLFALCCSGDTTNTAKDVTSYSPRWYSTIFACGFSNLTCFFVAYLVWSFGL